MFVVGIFRKIEDAEQVYNTIVDDVLDVHIEEWPFNERVSKFKVMVLAAK